MTAKIVSVAASATHRFSKTPCASIHLLQGLGVAGDAHAGATVQHLYLKRKHATAPNLSQVHLLASEHLAELAARGFSIQPGELGENVLTSGLDLHTLPYGTELRLGKEAVVLLTGLRTPCSQIDRFCEGLQQQMWGPRDGNGRRSCRAGVMSTVVRSGYVTPGDTIDLVFPQKPHQRLQPL